MRAVAVVAGTAVRDLVMRRAMMPAAAMMVVPVVGKVVRSLMISIVAMPAMMSFILSRMGELVRAMMLVAPVPVVPVARELVWTLLCAMMPVVPVAVMAAMGELL